MNLETVHYRVNREMTALGKWFMVGVCLIFISGCAPESNDDLHRYVQSIKARKAAKIAPLPDFKTYESYAYSASGKRDPFQPMQDDDDADDHSFHHAQGGGGVRHRGMGGMLPAALRAPPWLAAGSAGCRRSS